MVIVFICDVLGKENNGTTIATMNVARHMQEKGHEVRIVCPDEDKAGLPGYYICKSLNVGPFNRYVAKNGVHPAWKDEETLRKALEGADVAQCNMCGFLSSQAVKICKEMGVAITCSFNAQAENYTNHVGMMNWHYANHVVYKYIDRHLFSKLNAVHYATEFMRDLFHDETNNNVKAYVVSNGVKKDFHPNEAKKPEEFKDKFVISFSARYSKEKDQPTLIKAVKLSKHSDDIQLILLGGGPTEKKLRKLGRDLKNPILFGFHPHEEVVDILNYSDIYVHPSIIDLEAISALEAMACGTVPVLSDSKRAAIHTFALSEENLFKMRDPKDLAEKIDYWFEHPKEREEYSQRYVEFAKRFDFDLSMDAMEKMFLEVDAENKAALKAKASNDEAR